MYLLNILRRYVIEYISDIFSGCGKTEFGRFGMFQVRKNA